MRRYLALAALALGLSLVAVMPAAAETPGTVSPACADIVGGGASYDGSAVTGSVRTAAPSCKSVVYTMVVYQYGADNTVSSIGSQSLRGDNSAAFVGVFSVPATTPYVCVFFVSSRGSHVLDVAPDSGCPTTLDTSLANTLVAGGAPGGIGYD